MSNSGFERQGERYAVVGCHRCDSLWIVDRRDGAATTTCPGCEHFHERRRLKALASADELEVVREQRGRLLADRVGQLDVILDEDDYGVLEDRIRAQLEAERELYGDRVDLRPLGSDEFAEEAAEVLDRHDNLLADEAEAYLQRRDQLYAEAHLACQSPVVTDSDQDPYSDESDEVPASEPARSDIRDPSITAVTAGDQPDLHRLPVRGVGPQLTTWLPELLETLLPTMTQAVRSFALDAGHESIESDLTSSRHRTVGRALLAELAPDAIEGTDRPELDVSAAEYCYAATEWAIEYADVGDVKSLSQRAQARRAELKHTLTTIGTGRGPMNAGHEGLNVVAALLAEAPELPILRVYLDAKTWDDLDDRATGERALTVLTTLATGLDVEVVLSSPGLVRALSRRYEDWLEDHLDFTASAEWWGETGESSTTDQEARATAQAALAKLSQEGQLRVLANLPADGSPRQQRLLAGDPDVGLSVSGVSRAIAALADVGLVQKDTTPRYNRVRLTRAGQLALEYVAEDYSVRDPVQATLGTGFRVPHESAGRFTETPHASTGTVYSAQGHERPPQEDDADGRQPSPEDVLTATGAAQEDGYVQWLGSRSPINSWRLHKRITAAQRGDGVTLVDDRIDWFEDGRVAQISCFEDEFLIVAQWGGSTYTMARLASALFDDKAFSNVLTPERLGDEFEKLFDGMIGEIEECAGDVLRYGTQAGWHSADEDKWIEWRRRMGAVKAAILEQAPVVMQSGDEERLSELKRELHGLIATATAFYHAAGIDVTINVRIPDIAQLLDDSRLSDFLGFMQYTPPKQTMYKHHSGFRMLLEDRPEKLQHRLEYSDDIDPEAITMDLTASWIISGPTATELQREIERAIEAERERIREQVRNGDELAAVMEIPVYNGCTYAAARDIVSDLGLKKGFGRVEHATTDSTSRKSAERITRLLMQCLNTPETPHQVCPHDVADVLLALAYSDRGGFLDVQDIAYGLSQLPPERLLPELTPSTTKFLQELLIADEPLGRSELAERTGVNPATWDRNYEVLAALDLIEPRTEDGYRRWTATLEPWWTPGRQAEIISKDDVPEQFWDDHDFYHVVGRSGSTSRESVFSTIVLRLGKLLGDDELVGSWMADEDWPHIDPLTSYASPSVLDDWRGFLWAATAPIEALEKGPPDQSDRDAGVALIGRLPPGAAPEQLGLAASAASADAMASLSPGVAVDSGNPRDGGDVGPQ